MRIAIISDIHGNLVALKAALSDIKRRKTNQIVCLGDVAATGPQPTEVIEHLRDIECPCIMGNTDETLSRNLPTEFEAGIPEGERKKLEALDLWTRKKLTKSHGHYLSTFKPILKIHLRPDQTLLCYHGSPRSNTDGILPTMPDEKLTQYLAGHKANIFAGGHTHTQMFRRFLSSLVINPGSIGLPFRIEPSGRMWSPATAEYAIVSSFDGALSVEFVSLPYSLLELRGIVRNSGMPNPDWWLSDWH